MLNIKNTMIGVVSTAALALFSVNAMAAIPCPTGSSFHRANLAMAEKDGAYWDVFAYPTVKADNRDWEVVVADVLADSEQQAISFAKTQIKKIFAPYQLTSEEVSEMGVNWHVCAYPIQGNSVSFVVVATPDLPMYKSTNTAKRSTQSLSKVKMKSAK